MTSLPKFTIQELIEAGVHYGHKTMRWNPKMAPYIYGQRNSIHIIDLQKTAPLLQRALNVIYDVAKENGRILFVGTKIQASDIIEAAANRSGQYYINHRWLGGMLTNFGTVSKSIKTMTDMEQQLAEQEAADLDPELQVVKLTKKERLDLSRKVAKLRKSLGGIREMGGRPNLLFVIDTNKENLAIKEANKLGIPVIAIIDSNSNPDGVDYPVPGNDDAIRSIRLYCDLVAEAVLAGMKESLIASGVDVGAISDIGEMTDKMSNKKPLKSKAKASSGSDSAEDAAPAKETKKSTKAASVSADDISAISAKLSGAVQSEDKPTAAAKRTTKTKKSENQ
jgi:small subunit ribosomal protein S2